MITGHCFHFSALLRIFCIFEHFCVFLVFGERARQKTKWRARTALALASALALSSALAKNQNGERARKKKRQIVAHVCHES